jgi:hypothetical protein
MPARSLDSYEKKKKKKKKKKRIGHRERSWQTGSSSGR